jgi:O-antigen ligase
MLELGWSGVALLAIQLCLLFVKATRAVIKNADPDAPYLLLMLLIVLLHNLSESELLRPQSIMWILIVISATALAKISRRPLIAASATELRTVRPSPTAAREI